MNTIVLIACVKNKQKIPCKAIELYQGNDFKNWVNYSKKINPNKTFILSGKHGLLTPNKIISPYDFNLNSADSEYKKKWAKNVLFKLSLETNLQKDLFIFLTNKTYVENILPSITNYNLPLDIM